MSHIIDVLIAERAERLRRVPGLWPVLRPLLYPLLGYREARQLADRIAAMNGLAAMRCLSATLDLDVRCEGLERIPARGEGVL